jgi:hypothetical protein
VLPRLLRPRSPAALEARQVHASLYIVELTQEASVSISTTLGRSAALMSEEAVSSSPFANSGFNNIKIFDDKCVTALLTILIMVVGC